MFLPYRTCFVYLAPPVGARGGVTTADPNEFSEEVLARVLTVGYEFELLEDGRSTWTKAMRMVAAALRRAGHNIPFTLENKKQVSQSPPETALLCSC